MIPAGRPFLQDLVTDGSDPKPTEYVIAAQSMPDGLDLPPYLTVCVDVKRRTVNGYPQGYEFTDKKTGKKHHTYYAWLLAENTPENLELLRERASLNQKIKALENQRRAIDKKLKNLEVTGT